MTLALATLFLTLTTLVLWLTGRCLRRMRRA